MNELSYILCYTDGAADTVTLKTDGDSGDLVTDPGFTPPEWTRLDNRRCPHCPLSPEEHTYCPVAKNFAFYLDKVSLRDSHESLSVTVVAAQRSYLAQTTVQRVLASLLGLISSLSPCPKTRFLKPMGTFHLPFASPTETLIRLASFQLLEQYLTHAADSVTLSMQPFTKRFQDLRKVNKALAGLLNSVNEYDAPANAMVLLDLGAGDMLHEIENGLVNLKPFFSEDD